MILGEEVFGEGVFGGISSVGGSPVPTPTPTAASKYISIIDTGVKIPSGNTATLIHFIAVDADENLLTDLTGFSVIRVKGSTAVAMDTPTVAQVNKTLSPGIYTLLCDEGTTISAGSDSESIVFQISQATMQTTNLRAEIFRPKISVGETLSVDNSGLITLPSMPNGWITNPGIANDVLPTNFNELDIEMTTGAINLTNNALLDIVVIMDSSSKLNTLLNQIDAASNSSGQFMADLVRIADSPDTLSRFAQAVDGNTMCVVGTGSTLTSIVTSSCDPVGVSADQFAPKIGTFTKDTATPGLRGKSFEITASTAAASPVLTVTGLTVVPADTDRFTIL